MALILCSECGKSISDKAASCPGCGCPVEKETIIPKPQPQQVDCLRYSKEELWQKAYDIQYKGKKHDIPTAIEIYKYIISKFSTSDEANYSKRQLEILGKSTAQDTESATAISLSENNNPSVSVYDYANSESNNISSSNNSDKSKSKAGRIIVGGICGFFLGLPTQNVLGLIFTTIVGAFVGTFDLPLVIFGGIIGVVAFVAIIVFKIMVGM